jgi:hypothetical protein
MVYSKKMKRLLLLSLIVVLFGVALGVSQWFGPTYARRMGYDPHFRFNGRTVDEWLAFFGHRSPETLHVRQVVTGKEPAMVSFEVPVPYEAALTNGFMADPPTNNIPFTRLCLYWDRSSLARGFVRGADGNCVFELSARDLGTNKHVVCAEIAGFGPGVRWFRREGPTISVVLTNVP